MSYLPVDIYRHLTRRLTMVARLTVNKQMINIIAFSEKRVCARRRKTFSAPSPPRTHFDKKRCTHAERNPFRSPLNIWWWRGVTRPVAAHATERKFLYVCVRASECVCVYYSMVYTSFYVYIHVCVCVCVRVEAQDKELRMMPPQPPSKVNRRRVSVFLLCA